MKLTFVGQSTYFLPTSLTQRVGQIDPHFVDFKTGDNSEELRAKLKELKSDVLIFFKPESIPNGALAGIEGMKIGWFTEPIPRQRSVSGALALSSHERDLKRRLSYLEGIDFSQFDRFISYDPLIAETLSTFVDVWRSLPLPVDDKFYSEVTVGKSLNPKFGFLGRPTRYRDQFILPALHENDFLYIAHGATGPMLEYVLSKLDVGINLHNEAYLNFENRVPLHLASGHLVMSDELSPTHGLEVGIDYLPVQSAHQFLESLRKVRQEFGAFDLMRLRGREKAEYFRASRIYLEVIESIQ